MTSPEPGLRARLKAALPPSWRPWAARVRAYLRRLGLWGRVLGQLRGDRPRDRLALIVSVACAPLTALRRLDRWGQPELLWDARIRVPGLGRFDCHAHTDDLWHVLPAAQPAVRAALLAHLAPGDSFVDAGANIGVFTVLGAACVGPTGRVVAIEMMPDTAARLRATLALNGLGWVRVVEGALTDRAGGVLHASAPPGRSGQARLGAQGIAVAGITLDAATADLGPVALVKLDLEGAEAQALAGAPRLLARTRALVYEQRPGEGQGIAALLTDAGFAIHPLDANNRLAVVNTR